MNAIFESCLRIYAIGRNTFIEAIRQKVLHVLVVFGLVLILGSDFFTQLAVDDQVKFLKDLGHAAISWTGLIIALMGAAQLIPAEIERRTIYTILSKPIRPGEFIFGKFLGLCFLLTLIVGIMSLIFWGVLIYEEHQLLGDLVKQPNLNDFQLQFIDHTRAALRDPHMIQAIILLWARLIVVAAISVFLSTVATSTTFIISLTMLIYLIGCMRETASTFWSDPSTPAPLWASVILSVASIIVPDFNVYSIIDEILAGNPVLWKQTLNILGYSLAYVTVLIVSASFIFDSREL